MSAANPYLTPATDEAAFDYCAGRGDLVTGDFARGLERQINQLEIQLAAERARTKELTEAIQSILPDPPYHPLLEPEWVYLSELVNKGGGIISMNEEQQRVTIARQCGWKDVGLRLYNEGTGMDSYIWTSGVLGRGGREIPDYLWDLNAMRDAEKTLVTTGRWIEYVKNLAKLVYINKTVWETSVRYQNGDMDGVFHDLSSIVGATAAQRAEAFLRTVGKWEGTPL